MTAKAWDAILGSEKAPAGPVDDFEVVAAELARHFQRIGLTEVLGSYPARIRPAALGLVVAHAARGREMDRFTAEKVTGAAATVSDPETAAAIGTAGTEVDPDDRLMAGIRIDRALRDIDDTEPASLLTRWLRAGDESERVAAAAALCRWFADPGESRWVIWGWWSAFGDATVAHLAVRDSRGGRPTREENDRRAALRAAARWRHSIGGITKPALAAAAGVSRVTLNAWLADPQEKEDTPAGTEHRG